MSLTKTKDTTPSISDPNSEDFIKLIYATGHCSYQIQDDTPKPSLTHLLHRDAKILLVHINDKASFQEWFKPTIKTCTCLQELPVGSFFDKTIATTITTEQILGPFPKGTADLFKSKINPDTKADPAQQANSTD